MPANPNWARWIFASVASYCLLPKSGKNDSAVRVFNFGQMDKVEKVKCSVVDARYEMFIDT